MSFTKIALAAAVFTITTAANADITQGLVGYWNFDDCTAKDASGNAYNGTIQGSPSCEAGVVGKALKFNTAATTDWIDLGTNFPAPKQFTLSAWVNIVNLPNNAWCNEGTIFAKGSACTNNQISYYMAIEGSYNPMFIRQDIGDGSGAYVSVSTSRSANLHPPKTNQWIHLVSTYDGKTLSIYGNGKKIDSRQTTIIPQDNGLAAAIGKSLYDSTPTAFMGLLDEIRIYNRALSLSEITSLYNQGTQVNGLINSLGLHTITCNNVTTSETIVIPSSRKRDFNCEASGLKISPKDKITITIMGAAE